MPAPTSRVFQRHKSTTAAWRMHVMMHVRRECESPPPGARAKVRRNPSFEGLHNTHSHSDLRKARYEQICILQRTASFVSSLDQSNQSTRASPVNASGWSWSSAKVPTRRHREDANRPLSNMLQQRNGKASPWSRNVGKPKILLEPPGETPHAPHHLPSIAALTSPRGSASPVELTQYGSCWGKARAGGHPVRNTSTRKGVAHAVGTKGSSRECTHPMVGSSYRPKASSRCRSVLLVVAVKTVAEVEPKRDRAVAAALRNLPVAGAPHSHWGCSLQDHCWRRYSASDNFLFR